MSYTSTPPPEIIAPGPGSHKETPINKGSAKSGKSILKVPEGVPGESDSDCHEELSDKLGCPYSMPSRDVPCTPDGMRLWLDRLDMDEKCVEKLTATSLEEFIELNPTWPLRAWAGLMLEMKDEGRCKI